MTRWLQFLETQGTRAGRWFEDRMSSFHFDAFLRSRKMKVIIMMIVLGLLQTTQPGLAGEMPQPLTEISINDFSRDRALFDSGQAVGRNAAQVPLSGAATPGEVIELRLISDAAGPGSWEPVATAAPDGVWNAVLDLPRDPSWLRVEVRNASEPTTRAVTANRFGIGHVIAIWGQSEIVRLRSTVFDTLTPEPLLDDDAIQMMWSDGGPVVKHLSNSDPHSSALAAMANVFLEERPGEKFAVVLHARSGTGFAALVDDSNPDRDWSEDAALHAFATADGQHVGLPAVSWFAAPGALGADYDDALFPLFTGKTIDGQSVSFPATLSYGNGGSIQADHWFGELYDPAQTRWVAYGPHRFDIAQDMQSAQVIAGGATDDRLSHKQDARLAWREMVANPHAAGAFLQMGPEPLTYLNGVTDGAGGWMDFAHPAGNDDDGAPHLARLTAHAILQASGLTGWATPSFDQAEWQPDGSYVEIWSSAGPVTTIRKARSEPALDDSFGHWTEVLGWQINGAPAERAEIVAGRVRLYPNEPAFNAQDIINYGEGGATGMIKFPQDYEARTYKDIPIVDVGAARIDGIALRPLPDAAVLQNTLIATDAEYSLGPTGPYFYDTAAVGAGFSQLQFRMNLSVDLSQSGARTLLAMSGNFIRLEILPSGTMRMRVRDSGGVVHLNNVGSVSNAVTAGVDVSIVGAIDLQAGTAQLWVDDQPVLTRSFASASPTFPSNRRLSVFATSSGTAQVVADVRAVRLWGEVSGDVTDPLGAPYKEIIGTAGVVNGDPWKRGDDAS